MRVIIRQSWEEVRGLDRWFFWGIVEMFAAAVVVGLLLRCL
jgi:hypothetical protein